MSSPSLTCMRESVRFVQRPSSKISALVFLLLANAAMPVAGSAFIQRSVDSLYALDSSAFGLSCLFLLLSYLGSALAMGTAAMMRLGIAEGIASEERRGIIRASLATPLLAHEKTSRAGSSGSGKTTVLKLLLGMYAPGDGSVLLGAVDVRQLSLQEVRRTIAVLPQEPWLFPGTVKENILLGKAGATDEEVVTAARLAHAHEFIEALPSGYGTVLDERGSNLSVGSRGSASLGHS